MALARQRFDLGGDEIPGSHAVPFSARTRMSGVDIGERQVRKGAAGAIRAHIESLGGLYPADMGRQVDDIARHGSTPLVVSDGTAVLGVVDVDPTDAVLGPGADHSRPSVRRSSGTQLGLRPSLNEVKPSSGSGPKSESSIDMRS